MTTDTGYSPNQAAIRSRNVTAVLGPTNTGKTHLAIERMLGYETGLIGLPLRLLAREVYDKVVTRVGAANVALITGEEKIKPPHPRYYICTVEAMPREVEVDFVAVDEIQLAADPERGHVFTERLFGARGKLETLLLGAATMRDAISDLLPGANFITRPRLSNLSFTGHKKISRLPRRTAIVGFSAADVYVIAELIRRQRGGAAVVLGALSPRTRNAQVALYQSGDVDFLIATDAIGMGLNLEVDHVAFSGAWKFDGQVHRALNASELGQIAGRAGRHINDGTFGVTGDVEPFSSDIINRLENHDFEQVKLLQWRNTDLDYGSVERLLESLRATPRLNRLTRARTADDMAALEIITQNPDVARLASGPAAIRQLWDVCQVPDYRKIATSAHCEMLVSLYKFILGPEEKIPEDWFAEQVSRADRTDGDIDTLATRIAHIRTWTFVSNRPDWLERSDYWQERTRAIEDNLSDALHEQLTQRFVDKRTSVLMRRMRDDEELFAEISDAGEIKVENHFVGKLEGFHFYPDTSSDNINGKAARHAAAQVLSKELAMRARRVGSAKSDKFSFGNIRFVRWNNSDIARIEVGESELKPRVVLIADEHLAAADREKVEARLQQWLLEQIETRLKPLMELGRAEDVGGLAKGIAFRLAENFGIVRRETIAEELKSLDQQSRAQLRKYGARFGAFNVYFPLLLKPAATELTTLLWILKHGEAQKISADAMPVMPRPGLTSVVTNAEVPSDLYRAAGFHLCGPRAVRVDMLERLADMIRPLVAWRARGEEAATPPKGSTGDGGFTVIPEMMSILGCSNEELGAVLKTLGFWAERKPAPAVVAVPEPTATQIEPTQTEPAVVQTEPAGEHAATALSGGVASDVIAMAADAAGTDATVGNAEIAPVDIGVAPQAEDVAIQTDGSVAAEMVAVAPVALDVVKDETASMPTADGASVSADAAEKVPVETEMVEVWRPRRRHENMRQGERRSGRGQHHRPARAAAPASGGAASDGDGAAVAADGEAGDGNKPGQRSRYGRNRDRNRGGQEEKTDAGGARGEQDIGGSGHKRPNDRSGNGNRSRDGRGEGGRDGGSGGDRPHRDRSPRRVGRNDRQPMVASAGPKGASTKPGGRAEKAIDPNSPFAALARLKQDLEQQASAKGRSGKPGD